jgi:pseudouridine kinase
MTEREKEIFEMIQKNPMISQSEMATLLNITRTSVGVHISNLIKKGYIKGKGYITYRDQPVIVIGGANMDIQGKPSHKMIMEDSNPGTILRSLGGVGRNIAENMAKMGMSIRLITAYGSDSDGQIIKDNAVIHNIDIEDCYISTSEQTSTYLYILDEKGDMVTAISDMKITEKINEAFLRTKIQKIDNAKFTVIDANLPEESLKYLAQTLNQTKLVLDTVSTTKALRVKEIIGKFYAIKPNKLEAEMLLGQKLESKEDLIQAGETFKALGVKVVIITLGSEGVYYTDANQSFFKEAKPQMVVNVTGAGDAFTAGLVYGLVNGFEAEALVEFAVGAASVALLSPDTIAKNMSIETINNRIHRIEES